jgi:hypothetical protein
VSKLDTMPQEGTFTERPFALRARASPLLGPTTTPAWLRYCPAHAAQKLEKSTQRNQLDVAVRFCVILALLGVSYLFAAALHTVGSIAILEGSTYVHAVLQTWWLYVIAIGLLILSWLSYQGAIATAEAYGVGMETAFDLHRFRLLAALHLPLPFTRHAETTANEQLSEFLQDAEPFGDEPDFRYEHGTNPASRGPDS